jgi:phenylalanyl-tRNA synthetase beta chain
LRFSRGVHPALAERGLKRAIELMRELGSGTIQRGIIDVYPLKAPTIQIDLPLSEVERIVGIRFTAEQVVDILSRLQFGVKGDGAILHVTVPDHRVDISGGEIGVADLCEEVARIYGYDRLPDMLIEDMLPPQVNDDELILEDRVRDLLTRAGLQEVINYRLTTPEAESRLNAPGSKSGLPDAKYVELANPISADKAAMRHTLLNGTLENIANNIRHHERQKLFEIGSVFLLKNGQKLPDEPRHLAIALTGPRDVPAWQDGPKKDLPQMDFFDLKGAIDALTQGLRIGILTYKPEEHGAFHPGRSAGLYRNGKRIGVAGEIHPLVRERYDLEQSIIAAELELDALVENIPLVDSITPIINHPAVYQDIALIVNERTSAAEIEQVIWKAGGDLLRDVRLFDVYRGDPIPAGRKSLAYALTYQAADRTLTDKEVAKVHQQIVKSAERQLGAVLRA